MKKRHFWAVITVMVLAIVMVFSFVACNGGDDKDPANIVGEEVSAEQWVKAFDYSDTAKITITSVSTGTESNGTGDDVEFTLTTLMEYDGDKMHMKRTTEYIDEEGKPQKDVSETYTAKEDDKVYGYYYDEDEEEWYRNEIEYGSNWSINFDSFAKDFAKFTYNKDKKGYVATYDIEGESVTVLIKIKDGKFVYAEQEGKEDGNEVKYTVTISGVGSTSITLPTVAEDDNN